MVVSMVLFSEILLVSKYASLLEFQCTEADFANLNDWTRSEAAFYSNRSEAKAITEISYHS